MASAREQITVLRARVLEETNVRIQACAPPFHPPDENCTSIQSPHLHQELDSPTPLPQLDRDWTHPSHICTGIGLQCSAARKPTESAQH